MRGLKPVMLPAPVYPLPGVLAVEVGPRGAIHRHRRVDIAGRQLEIPITAKVGRTRRVRGRGHVGPGRTSQRVHERLAGPVRADVTAVEQQVRLRAEGGLDNAELAGVIPERLRVHGRVAERERPGAAVPEHVHRLHLAAPGQGVCHDLHAVCMRIDQHDLGRRVDAVGQGLPTLDPGIDKDDRVRLWAAVRRLSRGGRTAVAAIPIGRRTQSCVRHCLPIPAPARVDPTSCCASISPDGQPTPNG